MIASVFFSSDVANPDTYPHFYADLQMYTTGHDAAGPAAVPAAVPLGEVAQKANKWQGRNITRWQNAEYDDAVHTQPQTELDPVKRAALLIKLQRPGDRQRRRHPGRRPARASPP